VTSELPQKSRHLLESLPPRVGLRLAQGHRHTVCLARAGLTQIGQGRLKTRRGHAHLMRVPTHAAAAEHSDRQDNDHVWRNSMITSAL
jgi:hypothetical protein